MGGLDPFRARAHLALGAIRLVNGATALFVPATVARRLGTDPEANPAPIYPLRMFGVRTVILGCELLFGDAATRRRSARLGIIVHASDTLSAAAGGLRSQLPARVAIPLVAISTVNTGLAVLGSRPVRRPLRRRVLRSLPLLQRMLPFSPLHRRILRYGALATARR